MSTEENQNLEPVAAETVTITVEQARQQSFALSTLTTALTHLLEVAYEAVVIANQGQLFLVYKNAEGYLVVSPVTDNQQLAPGTRVTVTVTEAVEPETQEEAPTI